MDSKKIVEILDKNINQEQLVKDLVMEMVMPAIDKYIAESPNKIDDAAWALAKDVLMKAVNA